MGEKILLTPFHQIRRLALMKAMFQVTDWLAMYKQMSKLRIMKGKKSGAPNNAVTDHCEECNSPEELCLLP